MAARKAIGSLIGAAPTSAGREPRKPRMNTMIGVSTDMRNQRTPLEYPSHSTARAMMPTTIVCAITGHSQGGGDTVEVVHRPQYTGIVASCGGIVETFDVASSPSRTSSETIAMPAASIAAMARASTIPFGRLHRFIKRYPAGPNEAISSHPARWCRPASRWLGLYGGLVCNCHATPAKA